MDNVAWFMIMNHASEMIMYHSIINDYTSSWIMTYLGSLRGVIATKHSVFLFLFYIFSYR